MAKAAGVKAGGAYVEMGLRDKITRELDSVEKQIGGLGGRLKGAASQFKIAGAAMAGAFAGGAVAIAGIGKGLTIAVDLTSKLAANIGDSMTRLDNLAKRSRRLGLAGQELGQLRLAGGALGGLDAGATDMALQRMTRRLSEAAAGGGEAVNAIDELGLSAKRLNEAGPKGAFRQIANAIRDVKNPADQLRLAFKLFDSEGAGLVATLNEGAGAIDELARRYDRFAGVFSEEELSRIEDFNDRIGETKLGIEGIWNALAVNVSPRLSDLLERLNTQLPTVREFAREYQGPNVRAGVFASGQAASAISPNVGGAFNAGASLITSAATAISGAFQRTTDEALKLERAIAESNRRMAEAAAEEEKAEREANIAKANQAAADAAAEAWDRMAIELSRQSKEIERQIELRTLLTTVPKPPTMRAAEREISRIGSIGAADPRTSGFFLERKNETAARRLESEMRKATTHLKDIAGGIDELVDLSGRVRITPP